MKSLFLISVVLTTNYVHAQLPSICGIWIGHNYSCYTINSDNSITTYSYLEVMLIEQNGDSITATKLYGDDCVETGQVTWSGNYISTSFPVTYVVGSPINPNSGFLPGNISVTDSNRLDSDFGVYFTRATCNELSDFDLNLEDYTFSCPEYLSSLKMPNAFTPNGDDVNEIYLPIDCSNCEDFELSIYNRWGNLVFKSSDPLSGWDGSQEGKKLKEGTYFWVVTISNRKTCELLNHSGSLNLLR